MIIILAAGESSRLGQAKQLLSYQNKTLIEHIVEQATATNATKIVVVLGAFAERIRPLLAFANIEIVKNENWKKGMSFSLQKGLEKAENADYVLVLLSDQPFVNTTLLNDIIEKAKTTDFPIIATQYNDILGVPALFKKATFNELNNLNEKEGAKKVIEKYAKNQQVGIIHFEKGAIDIDTMTDYERLLKY
jgi:molybdenum cofactor cytidylyltransferase